LSNEATELIFNLIKLKKVNPWDVKISEILKQLSKELREKGYIQFTLSGLLLLASSIVYLRKTETLLSIEHEEDEVQEAEDVLEIPLDALEKISPYEAPLRPSPPVIDLERLVKALIQILEKEYSRRPVEEEILPPIAPQPDDFMRGIEKKVEEFRKSLYKLIVSQGRVSVRKLIEGKQSLEAARTFILILFVLSESGFDIFFEGDECYIVTENGYAGTGI
jgi:chromatin segregation and condensation protein Rec8/ScpA/Scc1 (kleisin family)